jgi:hypothetical protein
MIINARSPYFILVNESGQVGSKIEIFLWNKPNSVPATATYTLSKRNLSPSQTENSYNISSFIREYIDNLSPSESTNMMWCNVRVKRYKETTFGTYGSALDTIDYIGVNGYTKYLDGYNKTDASTKFVVLADTSKEIQYTLGTIPSVNIAINTTLGDKIEAVYKDLNGRNAVTTVLLAATDSTRKDMLKVDLSTSSVKYNCGNTITLNYYVGATLTTTKVFRVIPVCEPKYTPVVCAFINRYGGWQFLNFFKAQSNAINVSGSSFKVMPDAIDYDTSRPQSAGFNVNGSQSVILNTGFVKENYSDLIQDLLLSETVLLDGKPAECKTTSTNLKTSLMDRNINYTIQFDYAYNLINNVI